MTYQLSVTEIEGIGPATEQSLNSAGYFFTTDLLFAPALQIHEAVAHLASPGEVEHWQEMAHLLEIEGMTGQWAEALVTNGVSTIEALYRKDLGTLMEIFQRAVAAGTVPHAPGDQEIANFMQDAAILFHTGHLAGIVIDDAGTPLEGVQVNVDGLAGETDARGRFRISRIPSADGHYLRLEHAGYNTLFDDDVHITHDSRSYSSVLWLLAAGESEIETLDEYDGDSLPPLTTYHTIWETYAEDELRSGDVFKVHELYISSPHVKLVSIFRAYRGGELIIRSFKVSLERFDGTPGKGDLVCWQDGIFQKRVNGPWAHEKHRAMRKLRHDMKQDESYSALEAGARIDWMLENFFRHYAAGRIKTG